MGWQKGPWTPSAAYPPSAEPHGVVASGTEDFNFLKTHHTVTLTGSCTFIYSNASHTYPDISQRVNVVSGTPTVTLESEVVIVSDSAQTLSAMAAGVYFVEGVYYANYVNYDAGSTAVAVGDTITGATSGATGNVIQVGVDSGDWGTNDAAGTIYFSRPTGTFSNNENIQVAAATGAVADGTSGTAIDLVVGLE